MHYFHPELSCWLSLCFCNIIARASFFPFLKNPHLTFFPQVPGSGSQSVGNNEFRNAFFLVPVLESRLIVSMKFRMRMWLAGPRVDQSP